MNAQQSYSQAGALGASPVGLVVRLYEKMIDDMRQVSDAIEKKDIRRRAERIKHAILIVGHLQSSLDFDNGGKVARDLDSLYNTWRGNLLHVQFHPSQRSVRQLITDVLAVRKAWMEVEQAKNPVASNAAVTITNAEAGAAERVRVDWQG